MASYDNWKTTNPEDEFLGPEPDAHCRRADEVEDTECQKKSHWHSSHDN